MSIKFVCSCGKRLKARAEMAGKRSACPRCGMPVGVPFLHPTHPGAEQAHMTPAERLRRRRVVPQTSELFPGDSQPRPATDQVLQLRQTADQVHDAQQLTASPGLPVDPAQVRLVLTQGGSRRPLEQHWYQCLLLPLRNVLVILGLAAPLTGLTGGIYLALPILWGMGATPQKGSLALIMLFPFALIVLGYTSRLLEDVFAAALAGRPGSLHWGDRNLRLVLGYGARWLLFFLAGPVFLAMAGFVYWIHCGDPSPLDWLILTEIGVATVAYWLLTILSASLHGRLRDMNPWRVAGLVYRHGNDLLPALLLSSLLLLAHVYLALYALEELHPRPQKGWSLLAAGWISGLMSGIFVFRWLGLRCRSVTH